MRPLLETVHLSMSVPRGDAGFWSIILELNKVGTWTAKQVTDKTNTNRRLVGDYIRRLVAAGYAEIAEKMPAGPAGTSFAHAYQYRLLKQPLVAPRIRKDGTELPEMAIEQLWRAIRMAKTFSALDLVQLCHGEIALGTAKNYARALATAGVTTGQWPNYRLVRDLGPAAPKVLAVKMVYDPNSKEVVGRSIPAREVKP
ncbi:MAG: hypothetical protein EOR97_17425 [Mesorhizobium sp.]|uniref:hypothetical protein n=1 Tax=Mesorhizobium sp. TaxID=1871066 RepID=UPI000FE90A8E|nr:hypothetical protein [Mesorhizobium sp.]RWN30152.1 MAG: hypothetical protein EOR97_17425 [Mesorhizobium sp.]